MGGLFITFEGVEGSGKSTQLTALALRLKGMDWEVVETREPGGTRIGDQIRQILLKRRNHGMTLVTELLLYVASRAQLTQEVIEPSLEAGRIVLCDRFADATLAYQGYGRNLPLDLIDRLNRLATQGISPHLTLLLDLDPEVGLKRIAQERDLDRLEGEELAFHRRVREGYLKLAEQEPDRIKVVAADRDAATIEKEVWGYVAPLVKGQG